MKPINSSWLRWPDYIASGCIVIGALQFMFWLFTFKDYYHGWWSNRFDKDIAPGATANAVEWIASQIQAPPLRVADWAILAILSLVLGQLIRIHDWQVYWVESTIKEEPERQLYPASPGEPLVAKPPPPKTR